MKVFNIKFRTPLAAGIMIASLLSSCEKFVELGPPPTQTVQEDVFKTDATATSAILGLYSGQPYANLYIPLSGYTGMTADDIKLSTSDALLDEFKNNAISITNGFNNNIWFYTYMQVKNVNYAISGLTASTTLTPAVKDQLLGEAKVHRAFMYLALVNLYGGVPMPLTGDAVEAAGLPRATEAQVWAQIVSDLTEAQSLLPAAYQGTFRARINKWTAATLLARVYLYMKEYAKAEEIASQVIASGAYSLPAPANAFVNTSNEIIWQIANTTGVSTFGTNFLAAAGTVPTYTMYDTLYRSFEANDLRKANWTGTVTVSGTTYAFVNKYKLRAVPAGNTTGNEYNVVLRLAELYLVRAEARAKLNNLSGAKADIDVVRTRASLSGVSASLTQEQMLLAIEQERKVELFGEWGHRWYDLKRTGRANAVIGGQKPATWQPADTLYPIPDQQRQLNATLTQNPGYF